jgi:hypothetical protein
MRYIVSSSEIRNAYEMFVGKPERKRPLETIGIDGG